MKNMLNPGDLAAHEVRAILSGMARVAHADGDDEREVLLMEEFWEACSPAARGAVSLREVRSEPFDAPRAREALATSSLQQTFVAACLLVAYSDGHVSGAEQATLAQLIQELAIDESTVSATHDRIKELLIAQLSRVSDLETLRKISQQF